MVCPRRRIGWLSGTPTTTSIPVVVLSDTDAAITINVYTDAARTNLHSTLTVTASAGGGTNPGSGATSGLLTKYCDDRTINKLSNEEPYTDVPDPLSGLTYVCWIGRHTLTGLSPATRYHITLTQAGTTEGDSLTDGISTCTAPEAGEDYTLWCLSCDAVRLDDDDQAIAAGARYANAYGYVRRWQEQNPVALAYIWFVDDWGYADTSTIEDEDRESSHGISPAGQPGQPQQTGNGYDYGLFYSRGMLGMGANTSNIRIKNGREWHRNWCHRNFNMVLPMWGDHEFINQHHYETDPADWLTIATHNAGAMAWNELFSHLSPAAIRNRDTASIHSGTLFGDAYLVVPDGKTRMGTTSIIDTGAAPYYGYSDIVAPWYGDNQIDDILDALDNSAPFKIMGKADGDKAFSDSGSPLPNTYKPNHQEMKQHNPTEWSRLFTRNTGSPASVMANPNTNGTDGVFITWNGDVHLQLWAHHADVADGSNHAENWAAWYAGTVSTHPQPVPTQGVFAEYAYNGGVWDGSKIHYISNSGTPRDRDPETLVSCLRIDINGSASPKQLVCRLYNDGKVVAKAIYEPGSNRPVSPLPWERVGWFSTPSKYVAAT